MNIYQISTQYIDILNELESNGGEITPEIENQLAITEQELEVKAKSYVGVIKTIDASNKAIDEEIKRLQAIKKTRVNLISNLKNRLSNALKTFNIDKIQDDLFTLSFRKSESVVIEDIQQLPDTCKVIKVEHISKTEIKKMIKGGADIPGADLVTNYNLQIK